MCRTYGMRLIGPNCIGAFGPLVPPPGLNKADISGNDLPVTGTRIRGPTSFLLDLASFGNPRKFTQSRE